MLAKNEHTTMVCFFRFSRKGNQIIAHHGKEEGGGRWNGWFYLRNEMSS